MQFVLLKKINVILTELDIYVKLIKNILTDCTTFSLQCNENLQCAFFPEAGIPNKNEW